ncbi:MAG: hypothetical protein HC830_02535 [Bacteroidetes bacterium]|nr:hypothetical protein [Bacteroidota bacterium]
MSSKNSNNNSNKEKGTSGQTQNNSGSGSGNKPKFNIYWVYILIGLAFFAIQFLSFGGKPEQTTWETFEKEMMMTNEVKKVILISNLQKVEVYIKDEKLDDPKYKPLFDKSFNSVSKTGPHYVFNIGEGFGDQFKAANERLEKTGASKVPMEWDMRKDIFGDLLTWVLPIVIIVAFWLFIFRRMSGGGGGGAGNIFNVGKSRAQIFDKETTAKD